MILLILDNAPNCPPTICDLCENNEVRPFPPNTTSLLPSLEERVTIGFKANYLTHVFKMVAATDGDNGESVTVFCKLCNIKNLLTSLTL